MLVSFNFMIDECASFENTSFTASRVYSFCGRKTSARKAGSQIALITSLKTCAFFAAEIEPTSRRCFRTYIISAERFRTNDGIARDDIISE